MLICACTVAIASCNVLPNNADGFAVTVLSDAELIKSEKSSDRLRGNTVPESTVWRFGALEGLCSVQLSGSDSPHLVIDDVLLSSDALFHTGDPRVSESGTAVLEQLKIRMQRYDKIKRVELLGHADRRGSASKNYDLAQNRAESVRTWLQENVASVPPMRVLSYGESKSRLDTPLLQLAKDRRVDVRIIATGAAPGNVDSTLCALPFHGPPVTSSAALKLANPDLNLTKKRERSKLEPFNGELPLSPGDQLRLAVAGDEDFAGLYEVSVGGGIDIPLIGRQTVLGLTVPALQVLLEDELVDRQIIRRHAVDVDAQVVEWASVEVFVRGSVFYKGRVSINGSQAPKQELARLRAAGDDATGRMLSMALVQAGGVRPDADLANIQILRRGQTLHADLSGLVHGELVRDIPLIAGDEVIVPSTGRFDDELAVPTQITPQGIKVYMSNASAPIFTNAQANITSDQTGLPYGVRLLQALTTNSAPTT